MGSNQSSYCYHQSNKFQGTSEQLQAIEQIQSEFQITTDHMHAIVDQFIKEMQKGLDHHGATVAMIPSFVSGRPTGEEKGKYLALDLGGTNLRVCQVELLGQGKYHLHQQKYVVSDQLKTGDMRHLCDFIADCVDDFISEHGDPHEKVDMGYTFSFPIWQTSINSGELKQWTKGFACANAVGTDPAVLLQDAFHRKNLLVNIAAIVNDTVGTLMAHAYRHPETTMGVILGTGSNTCYYEDISRITKFEADNNKILSNEMVVNMEWGAFDCERRILPFTMYDNKLNRESVNINEQLFEKMISGMYLAEIARNCMLHWIDRLVLFGGQSSPELNMQWRFETAYMSTIHGDHSPNLTATKHVLEDIMDMPAGSTTLADRQLVQAICIAVGQRSARLAACGLAGIIKHKKMINDDDDDKKNDCLIAIDGSLFEFYPEYEANMMSALVDLFGEKIRHRVRFELSRDGSGLGASVIAMMASKMAKQ
ncbi:hexokinase-domain-containing protein [Halteromyces radiatus]|uniref:hexokinase-domain-containing protein n=1 Tax=Halteromyces radiatus TaxID=101107 RepID=UPI002220ECFB|nr:hexokinase-domain-containing protein [Halteromyces radiatus]KAI8099202.1 hexokinase-domain-containing protein [Halteromyces radiatus]